MSKIKTDTNNDEANKGRRMNTSWKPWTWVPSLYLAESIPYTIAMAVSVVLYKDLGLSNTEIAFYNKLALSSVGH